MEEYLSSTVKKTKNWHEDSETSVLAVMGNEACDLDSAVSAIAYAFFISKVQSNLGKLVVPILNIQRNEFRLRTEVVHIFNKTNISVETLIFRDDINLKILLKKRNLEMILVDHNILPTSDKDLDSAVIEILDHHKSEYTPNEKIKEVIIEPVGSCCTLVAEKILQRSPEMLTVQLAMLLYSAILIDTTCLSEITKRATLKDKTVVGKLEKLLVGVVRKELFDDINQAKNSIAGFTVVDLLHKDQKVLKIGEIVLVISTLVVTIQDFVSKLAEPDELRKYCSNHQVDILVLLTSIINGDNVTREVAVFSPNLTAATKVCKILKESEDPNLSLEPLILETSLDNLTTFTQRNILFTRKAVLPLLKDTIKNQSQDFHLLFKQLIVKS